MHTKSWFVITLLFTQPVWSATLDMNNHWQCTTTDNMHIQWIAKNNSKQIALNHAFDECKKNSQQPASCQTSNETCENIVQGMNTKPMWQCTALDQLAKPWDSNIYDKRDDAAIAAKAYCEERSSMPQTCYINLLTCKDLNMVRH